MDYPCHARFTTRAATNSLGMPILIVVGNAIRKVPRPSRSVCPFTIHKDGGFSLRGQAMAGIFCSFIQSRVEHMLLISWDWSTNSEKEATHSALKRARIQLIRDLDEISAAEAGRTLGSPAPR